MTELELVCQVAFIVAAALFLSAIVMLILLYRLSDEYKRRHPDKYLYDRSHDKWVRVRKERKRK